MKKYCLTLDAANDPVLLAEYDHYHQHVWPEIKQSILDTGIIRMEIYRFGTRLFMMMETTDEFSFERKHAMDTANPKVQEWETLMWKYQRSVPGAKPDEKWVLMNKVFDLQKV